MVKFTAAKLEKLNQLMAEFEAFKDENSDIPIGYVRIVNGLAIKASQSKPYLIYDSDLLTESGISKSDFGKLVTPKPSYSVTRIEKKKA